VHDRKDQRGERGRRDSGRRQERHRAGDLLARGQREPQDDDQQRRDEKQQPGRGVREADRPGDGRARPAFLQERQQGGGESDRGRDGREPGPPLGDVAGQGG
jgi:hypothetical protein